MPDPMPADWGLADIGCQPWKPNRDDRGYALLNRDPWFNGKNVAILQQEDFKQPFSDVVKLQLLEGVKLLGVNGSSNATFPKEHAETRFTYQKELLEHLEINSCKEETCDEELKFLALESFRIEDDAPVTQPAVIVATTTALNSHVIMTSIIETQATNPAQRRSHVTPSIPHMTSS